MDSRSRNSFLSELLIPFKPISAPKENTFIYTLIQYGFRLKATLRENAGERVEVEVL